MKYLEDGLEIFPLFSFVEGVDWKRRQCFVNPVIVNYFSVALKENRNLSSCIPI